MVFYEDKQPRILDPQGMVVVMLLRRMAYNLLRLYRTVTQRSGYKRRRPRSVLLRSLHRALLSATDEMVAGLRRRSILVPKGAGGHARSYGPQPPMAVARASKERLTTINRHLRFNGLFSVAEAVGEAIRSRSGRLRNRRLRFNGAAARSAPVAGR